MAWQVPPVMLSALNNTLADVEGSSVPQSQRELLIVTKQTLDAIAADVHQGLLETVGVNSSYEINDRCSVVVELPLQIEADTDYLARAIDAENLEAWCDDLKRIHVAIGPWYSTKDVDQVVLCVTKVLHVELGLHASDKSASEQPKSKMQRVMSAVADILTIQKRSLEKKD